MSFKAERNLTMKKTISFLKMYKFDLCIFALLVLALTLAYIKYYVNDLLPLSGADGALVISNLAFIKESINSRELPLWNKYLSAGMPMAGNISMHSFYLPAIILSFLPLKEFYYCYYILHVAVGAMFFYLLLKQIGCQKEIASVMAFVYLFSIHLGGLRKSHMGIIITSIYLPIIIYFIEKYFQTKKFRWLVMASAAMALQLCGGFVQNILYSDVFVGMYLLVGCIRRKMEWKKCVIHLFLWFCTYIGFISIQLIPFLDFLTTNNSYNQSSSSVEFFTGYSLHPIKLLQMIFPKFFVNILSAVGTYYSSGTDIELYLGPVIFLLLFCGVIMFRREYRIKAYGIASLLVLSWASIARFPAIAKVCAMLPFVGQTRVQARILFIFFFLALLMAGYIGELIVERKEFKVFFEKTKFLVVTILIVVAVGFVGALVSIGAQDAVEENYQGLISYFENSYYKELILYLLCLFVIWCLNRNEQNCNGKIGGLFLIVLLIINLVGILPFSLQSSEISISELEGKSIGEDKFLKENAENYKVWDDYTKMSAAHNSSISNNKSAIKGIAAINSYTNFSNPRLYMMLSATDSALLNNSGMLIGNALAYTNLVKRNDVLSMLGIKYIIDTEQFLDADDDLYVYTDEEQEVIFVKKVRGRVVDEKLFLVGYNIALKPNTFYKIEFKGSANATESMYCDFYGMNYDNENQDVPFTLTNEEEQYEFMIFSEKSAPEYAVFRIICADLNAEIEIKDLKITEMETYELSLYQFVYSTKEYNIYENTNANDILYFSNVRDLEEDCDIYKATDLRFNENSYIGEGIELNNTSLNKSITDIVFGINSINANVYTDEEAFINFSQTYDSGWKVYIDGVETKNYMVNGLIMGTYISPGSHTLEFCYRPTSVVIGAIITFSTIIILLIVFVGKIVRLRTSDKVALS